MHLKSPAEKELYRVSFVRMLWQLGRLGFSWFIAVWMVRQVA